MEGQSARRTTSPWRLLLQTAGTPAPFREKLGRFVHLLGAYADGTELDGRLAQLMKSGIIEKSPTRVQLFVGAADMLRFWISPAASEYYSAIGIDYTFHQILRFLDEPASLADPVGLFSSKDGIIGHLMQVVHANPRYDLELLGMWPDGLDELERQIESMLAGTHPRSASIGAIVEEPDYHARLLDYTRSFKKNPSIPAPLRVNVAKNEHWQDLERTFGSLRTSMRYFRRLPTNAAEGAWHLAMVDRFPTHWAEPKNS